MRIREDGTRLRQAASKIEAPVARACMFLSWCKDVSTVSVQAPQCRLAAPEETAMDLVSTHLGLIEPDCAINWYRAHGGLFENYGRA